MSAQSNVVKFTGGILVIAALVVLWNAMFIVRPDQFAIVTQFGEPKRVLGDDEEAPLAATALVGELEVLVPMAGLIDKTAELARLDKEIGRLEGEVKRVGGKLSNPGFVDKAPAAVIDKERAKLAEAEKALAQLSEQRAHIASL